MKRKEPSTNTDKIPQSNCTVEKTVPPKKDAKNSRKPTKSAGAQTVGVRARKTWSLQNLLDEKLVKGTKNVSIYGTNKTLLA